MSIPLAKRIIIRAHECWHDKHKDVVQAWFRRCGYEEDYDWTSHHHVHLSGVNGERFHVIIDMEKNLAGNSRLDEIPHEIYRLTCLGTDELFASPVHPDVSHYLTEIGRTFVFQDPKRQTVFYKTVRQFADYFPYGG